MMMFLLLLAGLACLVAAGSFVWLAIVAFRTHILWGLAVLFLPLAPIVFAVMNWHDAKKPFLVNLGSSVLAVMLFFGAGGAAFMMATQMSPETMAVTGPELQVDSNQAYALADAAPPDEPEEAPAALDTPDDDEGSSNDHDALAIALNPSSLREQSEQASVAQTMRRPRRSPGDEIPVDEIDESYVGSTLRVVSNDGLDSRARLIAVDGAVLSFERDIGIGAVTFDLRPGEIEAVYLTDR
jgi:hypothetical protein